MQTIELEAKSVEEATELAAEQLCCAPDAVQLEVIEEKKGFLGMGKRVKVRAMISEGGEVDIFADTPKPESADKDSEPPAVGDEDRVPSWAMDPSFDPEAALKTICQEIIPEATVNRTERNGRIVLEIKGDGSGIFIGRKGMTLEALQFIINKMYLKQTGRADHILVDSEGYIGRKIEKLRDKAMFLARKVRDSRRPQTTEPLNAHDRRIIHTTIRDKGGFTTRSIGDGEYKRVQINTKRGRR